MRLIFHFVIPALPSHGPGQALGIHKPRLTRWIPAFAGMTGRV